MKKLTTVEFIEKAKKIHGDRYDYSKSDYVGSMLPIDIICKEHGLFQITPNRHLSKRGCIRCGNLKRSMSRRKTTKEFIINSIKIHGNRYDYSKVNYIDSRINVEIICPKHGVFNQKPNNHLKGFGCSQCSTKSIGELFISNWLNQNNIKFEIQKTFIDCKSKLPLRYDFYLPDYHTLIEYDGEPHFKEVEYLGGQLGFEYRKLNDKIKNEYAENNKIKLLRISYIERNNISTILKNNL